MVWRRWVVVVWMTACVGTAWGQDRSGEPPLAIPASSTPSPPLAIPAPTDPPPQPAPPPVATPAPPPVGPLLPPAIADPIGRAVYARGVARKKHQLGGSISLLTWSVANLGVGAGGWALADDTRWKAFHRANFLWNTINVAIAIPSVIGAAREDPTEWTLGSLMTSDRSLVLAYGINTGLDVAYVFAGAFLHEYGRRIDSDDLVGTGWSLMIQGGYLFIYDLVMWMTHAKGAKAVRVMPEVGQVLGIRAVGRF